MGSPLNLFKALEKGYIRQLTAVTGGLPYSIAGYGTLQPPPNKRWIILGGWILHVTGSTTQISCSRSGSPNTAEYTELLTLIAAVTVSSDYPLFNTVAAESNTGYRLVVVDSDEQVVIGGGTDAALHLKVLEWEP